MHCVASNQIDPSYMVYGRLFSTLVNIISYPPPFWPLPFHFTKISRKGRDFPTNFPGVCPEKIVSTYISPDYYTPSRSSHRGALLNLSVEGTGTRPDYLSDRADKKLRGQDREIEKYLQCANERWGCGRTGHVDKGDKSVRSWNQHQTLIECLSCHIYCAHLETLGTKLLELQESLPVPSRSGQKNVPSPWTGGPMVIDAEFPSCGIRKGSVGLRFFVLV